MYPLDFPNWDYNNWKNLYSTYLPSPTLRNGFRHFWALKPNMYSKFLKQDGEFFQYTTIQNTTADAKFFDYLVKK